jgi:iron complex transport system substrate-binding protein
LKKIIQNYNKFTNLPRVYIEIYGNPIMSVSDESFVGELITFAGGNNIFPKLPRDYSRINPEEVINNDPEIIILTYPGMTKEQVVQRKGWEVITAVKTGRIYTTSDIDPDVILRASPRIIEGLAGLIRIFHEK